LEKAVLRDVAMRAESARPIDLDEIRVILPEEIKRAGSVSAWCRQVGLDRSNLSQVLHKRRRLGGKILAALKLSNVLLDADLANAGAIIRRGTKTALTKRKLLAPPQSAAISGHCGSIITVLVAQTGMLLAAKIGSNVGDKYEKSFAGKCHGRRPVIRWRCNGSGHETGASAGLHQGTDDGAL
jgi:hypothetical protein